MGSRMDLLWLASWVPFAQYGFASVSLLLVTVAGLRLQGTWIAYSVTVAGLRLLGTSFAGLRILGFYCAIWVHL